eukprot:2757545-Pyramimonas_sp.AAC.1
MGSASSLGRTPAAAAPQRGPPGRELPPARTSSPAGVARLRLRARPLQRLGVAPAAWGQPPGCRRRHTPRPAWRGSAARLARAP